MIVITDTFLKLLSKIKSVSLSDVAMEIDKHSKWLENFKLIWTLRSRKVLKGYLLSKKVRLVVLFQEKNGNYLPFYVVKKETKDGFNISRYSVEDLDSKLDSIFSDLEKGKYKIY